MKLGNWFYSNSKANLPQTSLPNGMGVIYIVRFEIVGKTSLIKIGASSLGKARLSNYKGDRSHLFCISIPHYNFFENEEILHERFAKYRVPPRPGKGVKPELFNLSVPYVIANTKDLRFETDIENVEAIYLKNYTQPFYHSKK